MFSGNAAALQAPLRALASPSSSTCVGRRPRWTSQARRLVGYSRDAYSPSTHALPRSEYAGARLGCFKQGSFCSRRSGPAAGTGRGALAVVAAAKGMRADIEPLLAGVDVTEREVVARVLEKAITVAERWDVVTTDFLSPPETAGVQLALRKLGDVSSVTWGGYPQAERQRLTIGRTEMIADVKADDVLALVSIEGNFMFDPATHRDFLGAVLGTGLDRKKIGDILLQGENGAHMLICPELVGYMQEALLSVRSVPVSVHKIELNELNVRPPRVDEIRTVEASMRLDAVASAGFRMPRSKCADAISNGDVKVNWKGPVKPSKTVESGDVISIRGKGRLEVKSVNVNKKGRFVVEMTRYL